jgi:hypothetical protein
MTAHPTAERLGAYLDGELDASDRVSVDAHLRECADCAGHLADLSAVDDAARRTPLEVPAGYFDDFAPRVRARLEKRAPVRWRPPVWGWAAAAALLLAVITPLALQERASAPLAESAPPAGAPAASEAGRLRQNSAPEPAATVPPASAALPQAPAVPAPRPGAPREQDELSKRQLESRIARRDRDSDLLARDEAAAGAKVAEAEPELQRKREDAAPVGGLADSAKLANEKKEDEPPADSRASGYVAPPPPPSTAQRQYGPRAQNTAPAPSVAGRRSDAESKDKKQAADAVAQKAGAGADAPAGAMQESVEVSPKPRDLARGAAAAKFRSLAEGDPPRTDGEARTLREAWRAFVDENPGHPHADEARVRLVEAGELAYRLGRRPHDREIALRDGRAYLGRTVAPQAARVRAALERLGPAER